MGNDRNEYLVAFAIGAIVGVGAALLLAPEPEKKRRRIIELEPAVRRIRRRVRPSKLQRGKRRLRKALRSR